MRTKVIFFLTNILLFAGNVYAQNSKLDSIAFYKMVESFMKDSKDYRCQDTLTLEQICTVRIYRPSVMKNQSKALKRMILNWNSLKKKIAVSNLSGLNSLSQALRDDYVTVIETKGMEEKLKNWHKQFRSTESLVRYRPESIKKRKIEWEKDFENVFIKYVEPNSPKNLYSTRKDRTIFTDSFSIPAGDDGWRRYDNILEQLKKLTKNIEIDSNTLGRLANYAAYYYNSPKSKSVGDTSYKLTTLEGKETDACKFEIIATDRTISKSKDYDIDCSTFQKIVDTDLNFITRIEADELKQYLDSIGQFKSIKECYFTASKENLSQSMFNLLKEYHKYNLPKDSINNFISRLKNNLDSVIIPAVNKRDLSIKITAKLSKIENSVIYRLDYTIYKINTNPPTIHCDLNKCDTCKVDK